MRAQYIFKGRNGETHKLIKTLKNDVYQIETDYPIGTTGRMDQILAIDFAGGPMLVVGELLEFGVQIEEIIQVNKIGVFVTLKEI